MVLRLGIIGTGYFGKHYVRLLQEIQGVALAGVVGNMPVGEAPVVPDFIKKYANTDEILQDPGIDGVIIATPPSTHAVLAISALRNNKHVLVEKPMASSLKDAHAIADAADKSDRVFMIGHQYCYNDHIRYLKKELEKKTIGEAAFLVAEHFYPGPIRLDVGCLWETVTHELAIIDYLFSSPAAVDITGRIVDMVRTGRDDFVNTVILFNNGLTASITASWFMPQKIRRMVIAGEKGQVVFDEKEISPLVFYAQRYPIPELPETHTSHFFTLSHDQNIIPDIHAKEPLRNQVEHFIECIKEKKIPITNSKHGMRVTELLHNITAQMRK